MYISMEGLTTAGISTTTEGPDLQALMKADQEQSVRTIQRQAGAGPAGAGGGTRTYGGGGAGGSARGG
jgi:hypothetical protein